MARTVAAPGVLTQGEVGTTRGGLIKVGGGVARVKEPWGVRKGGAGLGVLTEKETWSRKKREGSHLS